MTHPLLKRAHRYPSRRHASPERVAQRMKKGDPALTATTVPHPRHRHRLVEPLARLRCIVGLPRVRVAEHEVIIALTGAMYAARDLVAPPSLEHLRNLEHASKVKP
jgi:hypothetical protein